MGWWFGRKSAPADARPFVPAWLQSDAVDEGFARSFDGMTAYLKSDGTFATYRAGVWELGALRASSVIINGSQVVGSRAAGIAAPSGGATVDSQARTAIGQLLGVLRQHGLIET